MPKMFAVSNHRKTEALWIRRHTQKELRMAILAMLQRDSVYRDMIVE